MQLSLEKIRSITCGAARVERETDGIHFYRLTKEQFAVYDKQPVRHPRRTATAGVQFRFRTDSRYIKLTADLRGEGGTGAFFSFDVYVNGSLKTCWDNFSDMQLPREFVWLKYDLDLKEAQLDLGEGEKEVAVHFPWNRPTVIHSVEVEDGAFVEPVKPNKKLIAFGDSITQGFYAQRPSKRYIARIAEALGAEEFNKAIGGEQYVPAMAQNPDGFAPDYILVAYGTNDWRNAKREKFEENCRGFYAALYENYPEAKVFALTPIWRYNLDEKTDFKNISEIGDYVRAVTAEMPNITVIDGFDLVPADVAYFADEGLHPNDSGFAHYYNNLIAKIKAHL